MYGINTEVALQKFYLTQSNFCLVNDILVVAGQIYQTNRRYHRMSSGMMNQMIDK
ncbi:hypothetical protein AO385_1528 [Moraxella catarrhalis]|uniref:Uncharacterized protein n=1 Tax=Moraxella catarrhalis TaxID=480 RepID=A0A198UNC8_MORCA|nr:hypothetical protein AO383_1813 [Moraxella catarrhalis]OAU98008.1 hypothetical protein AO384_0255 [Moraxella catarrhalis]OAU98902.1 hypothetical protein AO385_1528 [Moraxella catarrhalis]